MEGESTGAEPRPEIDPRIVVMDVLENLGRRRIEPTPDPVPAAELDRTSEDEADGRGDADVENREELFDKTSSIFLLLLFGLLLLPSLNNDSEGRDGNGGGIASCLLGFRVDDDGSGSREAGVGES